MAGFKLTSLLPVFTISCVLHSLNVAAFPAYRTLAGVEEHELSEILAGLIPRKPAPPPEPLEFLGTKLVNDAAHPFIAPTETDMRGPCPGLNTLANHGVSLRC
jgi:unspecific peroxygenase